MSQEENPAHPDDIEEDQQSSDDWEHVTPQDEGFSVESQREEPTYTELVPVPVSQNDISMSSQPSTSSQYQSHDESIGDLSGQPSTSSQYQSPDDSIGDLSGQPSTSSQYQSPDDSIGDLDGFIDAYLKETDLKDNSGDAESFPAFDNIMSSKSLSNEEPQTSEDESPQATYDEVFTAPVMGALQQTG